MTDIDLNGDDVSDVIIFENGLYINKMSGVSDSNIAKVTRDRRFLVFHDSRPSGYYLYEQDNALMVIYAEFEQDKWVERGYIYFRKISALNSNKERPYMITTDSHNELPYIDVTDICGQALMMIDNKFCNYSIEGLKKANEFFGAVVCEKHKDSRNYIFFDQFSSFIRMNLLLMGECFADEDSYDICFNDYKIRMGKSSVCKNEVIDEPMFEKNLKIPEKAREIMRGFADMLLKNNETSTYSFAIIQKTEEGEPNVYKRCFRLMPVFDYVNKDVSTLLIEYECMPLYNAIDNCQGRVPVVWCDDCYLSDTMPMKDAVDIAKMAIKENTILRDAVKYMDDWYKSFYGCKAAYAEYLARAIRTKGFLRVMRYEKQLAGFWLIEYCNTVNRMDNIREALENSRAAAEKKLKEAKKQGTQYLYESIRFLCQESSRIK